MNVRAGSWRNSMPKALNLGSCAARARDDYSNAGNHSLGLTARGWSSTVENQQRRNNNQSFKVFNQSFVHVVNIERAFGSPFQV